MDSLRWILLGLGILVIVGVYLWTQWQAARGGTLGSNRAFKRSANTATPPGQADDHLGFDVVASELSRLEQMMSESDYATDDPAVTGFKPIPEPLVPNAPLGTESQLTGARLGLPGANEKLIIFSLVAPPGCPFQGSKLRKVFSTVGLKHGVMQIYHRRPDNNATGKSVFSVASLVEPGSFDLETMDRTVTPGLSLFMRLPGPIDGAIAFDDLISVSQQLTAHLGGELRDETRSVLSRQRMENLREDVVEFERKQNLVHSNL